jgi:hypothetical protein
MSEVTKVKSIVRSPLVLMLVAIFASVTSAVVVNGISSASIPDGSGVIHGCYKTKGTAHPLKVIDSAVTASCPKGYTNLNWNQTGPQGPEGQAGTGLGAIFGDGSDGNVTISTNTTLTQDMYYDNLTLDPGVVLNPDGYRIFVSGTLNFGSGSSISANGNDGSSSSGGAALPSGTLGGSGGGGFDNSAGGSQTNSLGGNGGGTAGASGGSTATPAVDAGGSGVFRQALSALSGRSLDGVIVNGGGGGGGSVGEGGGSGGGVVVVIANAITVGGSADVTANGGAGAGTGAGGGGGVVVVITDTPRLTGITLSTQGGAGGGAGSAPGPGFTDWLS